MAVATVADFVENLRTLPLLTPEQQAKLAALQQQFPDIKLFGKELIRQGWLTPFQANQIAKGNAAELVLGPYVLLDRLGEGGMGAVYKARHTKMDRLVALKVIRKELLAKPDAVSRFEREVKAAARLTHPNIVIAFDAGQAGETHFFAMEYVEGTDLHNRVNEKGPLAVAQACDCIRQAALGLQHAHEQGMVHRDIKPHNLLLTKKGVVKILDMGLARLRQANESTAVSKGLTQEGACMGTPSYMAPEQALDTHKADIRADIYSLGCTFYFLLTGRTPFEGTTVAQVLVQHQMAEAEPVESLRPEVPSQVSAVVSRMMAKKPQDRYQTPGEVAQALELLTGGGPASITQTSSPTAAGPAVHHADTLLSSKNQTVMGRIVQRKDRRKIIAAAAGLVAGVVFLSWLIFGGTSDKSVATVTEPTKEPTKPQGPEKSITNSIGMKLVYIPPGKFTMGSSQQEIERSLKLNVEQWIKDHLPSETPEHEVEITNPFYIGATEVTVRQFRQFVTEKQYNVGDERWKKPGFQQTEEHPVVWVSWNNAVDFCAWISEKEGKHYRLPTEAEWEYCCRTGKSGNRYCFGNEDADLGLYGWYVSNSGEKTHPVGKLRANEWGLFDMHGNAWEWCQDNYEATYYATSPKRNPTGGAGGERVIRGGSIRDTPLQCRATFRDHHIPDFRNHNFGFRVVLVPSSSGGVRP